MNYYPDDIIHGYLAAYLAGKATEEQALIVQQWLKASSGNEAYFNSLKKTWEESGRLNPQPVAVDIDKAWNKLAARMEAFDNKKNTLSITGKSRFLTAKFILRAAAVVIPVIFLISLFFWKSGHVKQLNLITQETTLQDTLPDGSAVTVNKMSKLSYPEKFKGSTREVVLEGEAYFEVKHDEKKAFIVHSGELTIRVLGTSFNVNAYPENNEIEVHVSEGRVMLCADGKADTVVLTAGEKGIFSKITYKIHKIPEENLNELFWKTKTLIFSKTELSMVVETLKKFYGVEIVLTNKELYGCRLSATFINQPIDTILDIIAESFNLTITKTGTIYTLDGKAC